METNNGDVLLISSFSVTASLCLAILVAVYFYYRNAFSYWRNKGLKNPPPLPFAGNFAHYLLKDRIKLDLDWAQKYGKIYGFYEGARPVLMVADADVLRQICIKDFDQMPNHDKLEFPNKYQSQFIIALRDDHWKRVRAMMSPTFTSGKIKRMFKMLQICCDDLIENYTEQLEAKSDKSSSSSAILNLKQLYGLFTMDAIASCCYGLKLGRQGAGDTKSAAVRDEFVKLGFKLAETNVPRLLLMMVAPKPLLRLFNFEMQPMGTSQALADHVEQIIKSRRSSSKKFDDYLQILLDAKFDDKMELNEMDAKENHHAGITSDTLIDDHKRMVADVEKTKQQSNGISSKVELTEMEILANAIFLLVVGLETTATMMTHCSYILGFFPDVQERLYQELKLIAKKTSAKKGYEFDYDELTSCQYLDAVISETLRILPPVIFLDRYSVKNYHIEKHNVTLDKGTKILLNYYAIMNDPDYWPNPRQFDPERFMPANKDKIYPGSYCPFGIGPRHCIGMRFSLTEAKLGIANMIMNFYLERAPGTKFPPEANNLFLLTSINTPVCRVSKRMV